MRVKLLFQILLLLIAVIISFFTINHYFYKNNDLKESIKSETEFDKNIKDDINSSLKSDKNNEDSSNDLQNVIYENFDNDGNKYTITARSAQIKQENSTVILMRKVEALIYLKDSNLVTITSDEAIFNNENFETNFSKNVELNYLEHQFMGQNLNLLFEKNLITMENQVVYRNMTTELIADGITIDLITKNSKIFMNGDNKRIKIFNNN